MGKLYTREKYLKTKENTHELPYDTSTFLLEESKNAGSIKKED
jgi:hypothetical protein